MVHVSARRRIVPALGPRPTIATVIHAYDDRGKLEPSPRPAPAGIHAGTKLAISACVTWRTTRGMLEIEHRITHRLDVTAEYGHRVEFSIERERGAAPIVIEFAGCKPLASTPDEAA